jgi:hypothetical protein
MTRLPFYQQAILATIATMTAVVATTATSLAEDANFGTFTLNPKTLASVVQGTTGGSTSLPAVTANNDRSENQCIGFGDVKPDHVMRLTQGFNKLSVMVYSSGKDTTLIIQSPNGEFRCADDFNGKDAGIEDEGWKAGEYKVWVGSIQPGKRFSYQLAVQAN